ncbi:MAG TPA: CPXCG motif-containing cysteine-rich protein [Longimicrobiaceae bacterium]
MGYGLHPDAFMGDAELEDAFPVGDGTADTSATVDCPYCGQAVEIVLDPGSGTHQEYVEDCEVCCRPWNVTVAYGSDGAATVEAEAADEL